VALAFAISVAILAAIFQTAYQRAEQEAMSYIKAVYAVINMASFQVSFDDMPESSGLDIFFVIVPLLSIPLLLAFGANLLHVIRVLFVRDDRGQMWQQSLAATVERPIVICGLGHVGYRVARQLIALQQPVVGIDKVRTTLTDQLVELDVPVLLEDVREVEVLRRAGVSRASTVIVCTHDDMANIEAAFHARELNPQAQIILRLFEDEIAGDIADQFHIKSVLSRSAIAAQNFAYAALGLETVETFSLGTETYVLAEIPIMPYSSLIDQTVLRVSRERQMTVVCLAREDLITLEPAETTVLQEHDAIFVFTDLDHMARLTESREPSPDAGAQTRQPIVVCGLGHTGYRVVNVLRQLDHPVVAVDFEAGHLAERIKERGTPVLYGDFRQEGMLKEIGVQDAQGIVLCTEDDMVNFQAGIRARALAPHLRIVMRIFEEPLGRRLQQAFNIDAVYSTSAIAAPAFVAAAVDIHLAQPVNLGSVAYLLGRMKIGTLTQLFRESIGALTQEPNVTVLLHKRGDDISVPPSPRQRLQSGDEIVVLATPEKLWELSARNRGARHNRRYHVQTIRLHE
jgi:Trk K+ transport system NAD-binding subunit